MKVAGIIAEYNPFHNGHAYHIAATRAAGATHIVVVLGGNFTQRGEPALLPKAVRTRMALAGGADLVVELPQPWSCASAEGFARGGVALLDSMGCVDFLSFGSEIGDIRPLQTAVDCIQHPAFSGLLQEALADGVSYAKAQELAVAALSDAETAAILQQPNNTLGVEYCRALRERNSVILPLTVRRHGAAHDAETAENDIAAAQHIRTLVQQGKDASRFLPPDSSAILTETVKSGHALTDTALCDRILLAVLRTVTKERFAALPGVREGLENRLWRVVRTAPSLDAVLCAVKTRRYTATRLRRILTAAVLDLPAGYEQRTPPYIRICGMNARGAEILHGMKNTASLPLFSDPMCPPDDAYSKEIFRFECKVSDLYGSLLPIPLPCGQEWTTGMIRL